MICKALNIFLLVLVCISSLLLVLPTINKHIADPNLVVYFNHDEGYLIDLVWYYYSGEKRESYQLDADYGLELIYLSDLARHLLSKFVDFSFSTFVLILRWLHFSAWIAALIALWLFVGRHFGKGWQQILAVILLAVRPAFAHLTYNFKPEPLVLLLMILGFDFTLRIIENPCKKNVFIALALSAIAFLIKFAGIFLLPGVIAAIYLAQNNKSNFSKSQTMILPKIKRPWILEFLIGLILIVLPFIFVLFYVRKSTGLTYFKEFGLLKSFLVNRESLLLFLGGMFFVFISFLLFYLDKSKNYSIKNIIGEINAINSIFFMVLVIFSIFILIFGFRWIFAPGIFLDTYSFNILDFSGILNIRDTSAHVLESYLKLVNEKLIAIDLLMVLLFLFYLICDKNSRIKNSDNYRLRGYKEKSLMVILIPIFLLLFSPGRFAHHHFLSFFVIMCILGISGLDKFITSFQGRRIIKISVVILVSVFFMADVLINAIGMLRLRIYQFHQDEDIVFDIIDWWRNSYPADTSIVCDHPTWVYLPPNYKNAKFINYQKDKVEQLRSLVENYKPQLLYYITGNSLNIVKMPPINEILPGKVVKLVKYFNSEDKSYKRFPNCKFVIYKIEY